jgi:hypothetical protein
MQVIASSVGKRPIFQAGKNWRGVCWLLIRRAYSHHPFTVSNRGSDRSRVFALCVCGCGRCGQLRPFSVWRGYKFS